MIFEKTFIYYPKTAKFKFKLSSDKQNLIF